MQVAGRVVWPNRDLIERQEETSDVYINSTASLMRMSGSSNSTSLNGDEPTHTGRSSAFGAASVASQQSLTFLSPQRSPRSRIFPIVEG